MRLKFIEVTNQTNWGKFMVARFEAAEIAVRSQIDASMGIDASLIRGRGWGPHHLLIVDLQTGEGAIFRHGGHASADLNKHRVWVCPMFEHFLRVLWTMDVSDLDALPSLIELTEEEAPSALFGYRRSGPVDVEEEEPPLVDGETHPLIDWRAVLAEAATRPVAPTASTDSGERAAG